ncbi:piggyBac transposable element-derived protein 4-like [Hydra vulgaris]|uniref:PiggyBac transposable element-derived protein 4-like n=1 Tax=Hydra vulgaris TaxID=6087 RepID=A0ABM4BMK7_HYDVU
MIREHCRKVYSPRQHLSVDESLVLFKGRLYFRQYIKTKRAQFGIKVYELTTADGITLDFLVCCCTGMYNDDKNSTIPSSQRIPIELMGPFLKKGHIIFTDNYYTSPSFASFLLSKKTYICGTIRANQKHYSKEMLNDQLAKGTAVFYKTRNEDNKMLACKYRATKDKSGNKQKVVYALSTYYNPVMVETGKSDKNGNIILKPSMVKSYNEHMGGVDRVDHQLHGIQVLRKSNKWYKKLAFRLILQCALNSQKIYTYSTGRHISYLDFLLSNIKLIFSLTPEIPHNPCLVVGEDFKRLTGRHFPSMLPPGKAGNNDRHHKRCRVCYAKGKLTAKGHPLKTVFVCNFCPSQHGLHPDECFQIYHTVLDYS